MHQAILPFFIYILLQLPVMIIGLNLVRDEKIGLTRCLTAWVLGRMLLYAILQILAVPMILIRVDFDVLFGSFLCSTTVLLFFGILRCRKIQFLKPKKKQFTILFIVLSVITIALILWQSGMYFFEMHLDEDDARWLAEANDALQYGDMMVRDYDTGNYLGYFQFVKDITSPWPMMLALVSRCLLTRSAIFAHTIYAPVAVITMYAVYWLIGSALFKKMEARATFVFCVAVINLFFAHARYTQSEFALVRIWQGKATVAGVILPLLLCLFLRIHQDGKTSDWISLMIVCCAACLMSGMGISLAGIVTGVYGCYHIVAYQDWKRIPLLLLTLLVPAIYLLLYSYYRPLF